MKLLHVILDTDMRSRHTGLRKQLVEKGIDISKLKPGDIIAFLNTRKTMLMVMTVLDEKDSIGFVGHYKSPHGRVPPEALEFIPRALGANGFEMNKAIKAGLQKVLGVE